MLNLDQIQILKQQILQLFSEVFLDSQYQTRLHQQQKADASLITKIDLGVSQIIKEQWLAHKEFEHFHFYSEEDHGALEFPSIIVDPIDGTQELSQGIGECAVSLGIFQSALLSHPQNFGFIFNPFTGFEISSLHSFQRPYHCFPGQKLGLVSRTEWKQNVFNAFSLQHCLLSPRGSIAFKLGLLAAGACDFVISLRPKQIWDVAAGTLLWAKRGGVFLEKGKEVLSLSKTQYVPPLLWCKAEDVEKLKSDFQAVF